MRLFLLLMVTVAGIGADFVCTCKKVPSPEKGPEKGPEKSPAKENNVTDHEAYSKVISEKVSKETFEIMKESFGEENLEKTFSKLRELSRLHPIKKATTEQKLEIKEKLESYGKIGRDKPSEDSFIDQFEINAKSGVAEFLFEGDVFATPEELEEMEKFLESEISSNGRKKRSAAVADPKYKWTNGIVPYQILPAIKSNAKKMATFNGAMKFIQDNSCIRFQENDTAFRRIRVENGAGCYAAVGMTGQSVQQYSLGDGCELLGIAAHELLHSLGFFHTQSRADRDQYVTINANAFPPDKAHNFAKYESSQIINYTPYEYGSTMHYGASFFATKSDVLSILPKDDKYLYTMGSNLLSFYDMKMLNIHYDCAAKCPPASSAKCLNGGYPNPNSCLKCICPTGYGGALCDQRPTGCGEELIATTAWLDKSFSVGDKNNDRVDYSQCVHWIKAPAGAKIKVKVTSMLNAFCSLGCSFAGLEFKLDDQERTNPRICCNNYLNVEYTSKLNPLPIMSFNRYHVTDFTIQFKYEGGVVPPVPVVPVTVPAAIKTTTKAARVPVTRAARPTTTSTLKPVITTTKPKPPVTVKPAVVRTCLDRSPNCEWLKTMRKFCDPEENQFRYRKYSCAQTCGLCGKADTPCVDYLDNNRCNGYVEQGKCALQHFAEFDCPKTCGLCEKPV